MKKIISFLLALCLISSFAVTAFADTGNNFTGNEPESTIEPRIEETEWVFRLYNGYLEKRLWSNTYGKWLTDWIIVGEYIGDL